MARFGWDPEQYARFADHRSRPFFDLTTRIAARDPRRVIDLGCGSGELTASLADRWPHAVVGGVDNSESMLAQAAAGGHRVSFRQGDLSSFVPGPSYDVVVCARAVVRRRRVQRGVPVGRGARNSVGRDCGGPACRWLDSDPGAPRREPGARMGQRYGPATGARPIVRCRCAGLPGRTRCATACGVPAARLQHRVPLPAVLCRRPPPRRSLAATAPPPASCRRNVFLVRPPDAR